VRIAEAPFVESQGIVTRRLCRTAYFSIDCLDAARDSEIPVSPTGVPEVWMTLDAEYRWYTASGVVPAPRGTTVLRPAEVEPGIVRLAAGSRVLRATCAT
jgi:hypothetical protein